MPNTTYFKEREVWMCYLGENIGHEENGSGPMLLRPVLIVKKYNKDLFFGIPLTTKGKYLPYYYPLSQIKRKDSYALLMHSRSLSAERLKYKMGRVDENIFMKIKSAATAFSFGG